MKNSPTIMPATLTGSKGEVIKVARWKVTELTAPAAPASKISQPISEQSATVAAPGCMIR